MEKGWKFGWWAGQSRGRKGLNNEHTKLTRVLEGDRLQDIRIRGLGLSQELFDGRQDHQQDQHRHEENQHHAVNSEQSLAHARILKLGSYRMKNMDNIGYYYLPGHPSSAPCSCRSAWRAADDATCRPFGKCSPAG